MNGNSPPGTAPLFPRTSCILHGHVATVIHRLLHGCSKACTHTDRRYCQSLEQHPMVTWFPCCLHPLVIIIVSTVYSWMAMRTPCSPLLCSHSTTALDPTIFSLLVLSPRTIKALHAIYCAFSGVPSQPTASMHSTSLLYLHLSLCTPA